MRIVPPQQSPRWKQWIHVAQATQAAARVAKRECSFQRARMIAASGTTTPPGKVASIAPAWRAKGCREVDETESSRAGLGDLVGARKLWCLGDCSIDGFRAAVADAASFTICARAMLQSVLL